MFNWMRTMLNPGGNTPAEMLSATHAFRENFQVLNDLVTSCNRTGQLVAKQWAESHSTAWRNLRDTVSRHCARIIPDFTRPFYLRTDASNTGWAAILLQADPHTGALQMVACFSGRFTDAATTQKTNHRECFAVVQGLRALGDTLDAIDYVLQCDHDNIRYWANSKDPAMQRWYAELARTNPPIQHIEGADNVVTDHLSRTPSARITPSRPIPPPNLLPRNVATYAADAPLLVAALTLATVADKTSAAQEREERRARRAAATTAAPTPSTEATTTAPTTPDTEQVLQLRLDNRPYPDDAYSAEEWLQKVYAAQLEHLSEIEAEGTTGKKPKLSTLNNTQVWTIGNKVCIPTGAHQLVLDVLARAHDAEGHPGRGQTAQNLSHIHIPQKHDLVERYVASCAACQHAKAPFSTWAALDGHMEGTMASIQRVAPWSRIALDYIGKISVTSDLGHQYILSCTDMFTRMTYWRAVKTANAETSLEIFKEICEGTPGHGLPLVVQTDNGTHFDGIFTKELEKMGVKHHRTKEHHHQSMARDERTHQDLRQMLMRLLPPKYHSQWHTVLPKLQFFHNARANRHLGGLSPHEVMHGFKARRPLHLFAGEGTEQLQLAPEEWARLVHSVQLRAAIASTLGAMEDKAAYDAKRVPCTTFKRGETVLVWYPSRKNKWTSNWQGPYVVQSGVDEHGFYMVSEMQAHGALAKPVAVISHRMLAFDMSRTSFAAEAARDLEPGEFVVDAIVAHRDSPDHPGDLQFQVRYIHLLHGSLERPLATQPWIPLTDLSKLKQLKDYCAAHGLSERVSQQLKRAKEATASLPVVPVRPPGKPRGREKVGAMS
jgi:hypothetical protein